MDSCLAVTSRKALTEFRLAANTIDQNKGQRTHRNKEPEVWERPMKNQLKVNTDGSWQHENSGASLGYVIRNEQGETLMAAAVQHMSPSTENACHSECDGFLHSN